MNYRFSFSPDALNDLRQISHYITNELNAPQSASKIISTIITHARQLSFMPERGRLYKLDSNVQIRSIHVKHHNIVYKINTQHKTIEVILIAHSRRNLSTLLKS